MTLAGGTMEDHSSRAVRRVIAEMHQNLGKQFSVDEMARTALLSKYHFCRVFHRVTGVSPGRFLSAIRFQRAKHLLLATSWSVTDISHQVGYASVGTFSARFSSSVGLSPSSFRRLGRAPGLEDPSRPPGPVRSGPAETTGPTVRGQVRALPGEAPDWVFVGLFPERIQQGRPVSSTVLPGPGPYLLGPVPPGTWFVLAHATHRRRPATGVRPLLVGHHGPVTVGVPARSARADLTLRPMRTFDPPVVHAADLPSLPRTG
ncbi:helix-turn-helix domain-containing protein [Micromonospora humida]|uniref:Helix-turn-helix transcriptional regulator n=2 Tax=Micromonospora humida TaxID=2809018 RepID=A0ABS2IL03_9ACTN|nr:helix-turn-helix transcriptional regulator [Micromonospora humida]